MDEQKDGMNTSHGMPGWVLAAMVVLAIVAAVGVGFGYNNYTSINEQRQATAEQMKTIQQDTAQQIAALEQKLVQADAANAGLQSDLGVVTKKLSVTQGELKRARTEAAQIRAESEQKIAELDTSVKSELATKASADDLNTVNGSVTVVKGDLETTKSDLKLARSELGTLIARNHEEIDVLRRMGERDYVEFTITGRKKPQKVGNVTVELRSVNVKNNRFTVALVVDDVRTEKKDRTVNEPILFYPRGSRQANEVVVNSVGKDKITGYISMPKNPALTATASGN